MATQIIQIQGGTVLTPEKHLDGLDTVEWQFESGVIGKKQYIRAECSTLGIGISGALGDSKLSLPLTVMAKSSFPYNLYVRDSGGGSIGIFGSGGEELKLVVDTIGGMMMPCEGDVREVGHQQGYSEGAG